MYPLLKSHLHVPGAENTSELHQHCCLVLDYCIISTEAHAWDNRVCIDEFHTCMDTVSVLTISPSALKVFTIVWIQAMMLKVTCTPLVHAQHVPYTCHPCSSHTHTHTHTHTLCTGTVYYRMCQLCCKSCSQAYNIWHSTYSRDGGVDTLVHSTLCQVCF